MAANVKATRDFSSAQVGSREKGEKFEYDTGKDPAHLLRDGFVEELEPKPAPSSSGGKAGGSTS